MKELPAGLRVLLLATSAVVLFVAVARTGAGDDAYAPNDWLFSHAFLAQRALDEGRIPFNHELVKAHDFADSVAGFQAATGLPRMSFYANTVWHFWNGLPLQPSLLATVSLLTGLPPEDAARLPLGGIGVCLLTYAAADLVVAAARGTRRAPVAVMAPLCIAVASAPLLLDLRVLMPSTSIVIVALLLLLLARRALLDDNAALAAGLAPLALLPFWYYTVSYFVILLFVGFLAVALALRARGSRTRPLVPPLVCVLVPACILAALSLNGALTSHVEMAKHLDGVPFLGSESGGDYSTHLNRDPWRSALLYAGLGLLFAPLLIVGLGTLARWTRGRPLEPAPTLCAQWCAGAALFSILLEQTVGVSFLNRSAIYLTPLAAVAVAWVAGRAWGRRAARASIGVAFAFALVATPLLVATAQPAYDRGDTLAFEWTADHVPRSAVMYGSLDTTSVLFRAYGYHDTIAFPPRTAHLERFWYGTEEDAIPVYLASFDYFVLRDDAGTRGFEEYGPLREPISSAAYEKFRSSDDLRLVFDNGDVQVFQVALAPGRAHAAPL